MTNRKELAVDNDIKKLEIMVNAMQRRIDALSGNLIEVEATQRIHTEALNRMLNIIEKIVNVINERLK